MNAQEQARPVGGRILTPPFLALTALAALSAVLILWRFVAGLGASTALNDGYPWGLWIAFDVVTGTALACGGYAVALLVYVLNRGRYHTLVRPALVTSALGYSIAGLSVAIDVGRPWLIWKVPLFFWHWNHRSVLLEVAMCIMLYTLVAWIELSPAFLERGETSSNPKVRSFSRKVLPAVRRGLPFFIAFGLLLPTMHQSSLGSLLLLSGPRLNALWNTPLLPLLFLLSCLAMGYGAVIIESTLSSRFLGRPLELMMLSRLSRVMAWILSVYLAIRICDLFVRNSLLAALFRFDLFSIMTWVELALLAGPIVLLASSERRRDPGNLFLAAMLLLLGGALYRFDVYLVAFQPGPQWSYFPSVTEILITTGLVAGEIAAYIALIKLFPILSGRKPTAPARAAVLGRSYMTAD
ncbi:MAG: Ni/Fe-hydrogenase cytochrome b subunit [Acidobacteria bacterium]|nr:Ni/Fe-hydrogenase cytochrome b subunit [Acidobacteriota bacterium]